MAAGFQKKSTHLCLLGAVTGDVIGSVYEYSGQKDYHFRLFQEESTFTDDSILTIAVAAAILRQGEYAEYLRKYARAYPNPLGGYGGRFHQWIFAENPKPYQSFGNGSAMRTSAIGWAFDTVTDVLAEAERCAAVTHDHPEGIKGAQAAALSVFLARKGESKDGIREQIVSRFGYDLSRTLDEIRPGYEFDESCQGTVPQAIVAFLESQDFEDAIRKSISLGGDADTLGAITGAIAEAYYGKVPDGLVGEVRRRVPDELWHVIEAFSQKYGPRSE